MMRCDRHIVRRCRSCHGPTSTHHQLRPSSRERMTKVISITLKQPLSDSSNCRKRSFTIKFTKTLWDSAAQSPPPSLRKIAAKSPSILGSEGTSKGVAYNYHGRKLAPLPCSPSTSSQNHPEALSLPSLMVGNFQISGHMSRGDCEKRPILWENQGIQAPLLRQYLTADSTIYPCNAYS